MTAKQDRSSKIKGSKASKEEKKGGKSKALTAFSQLLFEWAPPEDLAAYDAAALDSSARHGYAALESWRKGKSIISVDNGIERHGKPHSRPVSVITIVNDNMPFLLDSIMGELNDHVSQIFMVVHPVLDIAHERTNWSFWVKHRSSRLPRALSASAWYRFIFQPSTSRPKPI